MAKIFSEENIGCTDFKDRVVRFAFGQQGKIETEGLNLGIVEFKTTAEASPHTHEVEEALYVLSGKGKIKIGDFVFNIKKGDFAHIPSGKSHLIITDKLQSLKIFFVFGGKTYIDH